MAENSNERKIFTLLDVTASIQRTLSDRYKSVFWVKAEMNKLHYYPHSGHCYPELVEKKNGKVIALLKATLWKDDFNRINNSFLQVLKEPLKDGITILFAARIMFDPVHGIALRILDIDPVFSLGELEREKQETLETLRAEGIYNGNKERKLPLLPQRLAIISVQTSKGYADFIKVVEGNQWGYHFFHVLFPSLLQGEKAVESIRYQLARIRKVISHFDVVAIIRGGGGDVGLSCFNNLQLAREIAMFPIPVITGIGHATNETAVEMISFKNAITPTELADYLLQIFHDFSVPVQEAEERVTEIAGRILKEEKSKLHNTTRYFRSVAANLLVKNRHDLKDHSRTLHSQSIFLIKKEKDRHTTLAYTIRRDLLNFCQDRKLDIRRFALTIKKDSASLLTRLKATTQLIKKDLFTKAGRRIGQGNADITHLERIVNSMDPLNVLKRGYSITTVNGKAVKSASQVKEGDIINTLLGDGQLTSEITSVKKQEET